MNRVLHYIDNIDFWCRVQCDKSTEIQEKIKQIDLEKSKLKSLGQETPTKNVATISTKPVLPSTQTAEQKEDVVVISDEEGNHAKSKSKIESDRDCEIIECETTSLGSESTKTVNHSETDVSVVSEFYHMPLDVFLKSNLTIKQKKKSHS